jgi:DnaJ-domain-containing protein 1
VNDDNNRLHLPIHLTMQDGRELLGQLIVNIGGAIDRTLNNEAKFILIADEDGAERMIAKRGILEARDAKKMNMRAAANGQPASTESPSAPSPETADPYAALGLPSTATDDDIREAFIEQAQAYNPDRLASMDLPEEVSAFCNTKYQQISEAYAKLTEGKTPVLAQPPTAMAG